MAKREKSVKFKNDAELLEKLKDKLMSQIQAGTINAKVSDLLKILELQKKLGSDSEVEAMFWEIIQQIRDKELNDD